MSGMELWKEKQVNSMDEFWKIGREEERNIFIDDIVVKEKNLVYTFISLISLLVGTSKNMCERQSFNKAPIDRRKS